MSAIAKRLIGEAAVPTLEELAPELLRIAEDGDTIDRVVRFLKSKGYTEGETSQELKKLVYVGEPFLLAVRNRMRDLDRNQVPSNSQSQELIYGLRQFVKQSRRRKP